jgi:signal transduction histidine kinase
MKFTNSGGTIRIELRISLKNSNEKLRSISVVDNGIGIKTED